MLDKSHRLVVLMLLAALVILAEGRPNLKKDLKELKELKGLKNKLCEPDRLTVYRVILNTYWNDKTFPKHFPQWRPPAQWSKLVGRSHDKSYVLFRLGQMASEGLKVFAESGGSDTLDAQSQGEGGVYDEFNAPPITQGEGKSEAEFFVDGNHSRVSLISKMVPSPDWFIGVDSFNLCVNGKWLDAITIEVDTVDAGTDNGFTFTSPNWPTEPQGVIHRLTSSYPNHPASSFYYKDVKKLPIMASFQFIKVKEYELSETFHHSEESSANEILKMEHISYVYEEGVGNTFIMKKNASSVNLKKVTTAAKIKPNSSPAQRDAEVEEELPEEKEQAQKEEESKNDNLIAPIKHHPKTTAAEGVDVDDGEVVKQNIIDIYSKKRQQKLAGRKLNHRRLNSKKGHHLQQKKDVRKIRPPRDCRVSEWSEWTHCSKLCDIGESTRVRQVVHHSRRGGRPCPPLTEKKWCGSARSCNRRYFNWSK